MRAVQDIPAKVAGKADVTGHANFETSAKLAHGAALVGIAEMIRDRRLFTNDFATNRMIISSAESATAAPPDVRRKARAMERKTQGQGPQNPTNRVMINL